MIKRVLRERKWQVLRVAKSAIEEALAGSLVVFDSFDVSGVAHATCRVLHYPESHMRDADVMCTVCIAFARSNNNVMQCDQHFQVE